MDANDPSLDNSNNVNANDAASVDVNPANVDSQSSSASSRGKTDPAWKHFSLTIDGKGKMTYTCLFCLSQYKGGGINRMKQHLAGKQGNIAKCKKVPLDVKEQMSRLLEQSKKANLLNFGDDEIEEAMAQEEQEITLTPRPSKMQNVGDKGKRKTNPPQNVSGYFAPRATPGAQPSLRSVFQSKEAIHNAKMRVARWLMDARIPFHAVRSSYFQDVVDAIAGIGPGFKGPCYDELRVHLLTDLKKECQLLVESYRSSWKENGCTLMADGWTDQRQRTLINFLVYCHAGMSFVKSVDASNVVKNASTLCNMFVDVIEWVGPNNIVHVVTDNTANYVAAGKLIHEKYDHIFWSPCAAHCLNLILKDISSMPNISSLVSRASKITIFVYNHMVFLAWLRKRPGWKEIVRPGVTRFATAFLTLKSIHEHKTDLQALVVNSHFTGHKLARSASGRNVSAIVLDSKFWEECFTICKLVAPLIRLLRIVDSDEKPSLGYVYEGMQKAKNAIKEMFKHNKIGYQPYTEIIKARWDKHLKRSLHAAAYFLNPAFFYDGKFVEKYNVLRGLLDLLDIKSLCNDSIKALKEMQIYRERKESFDRPNALQAAKELQPSEWWRYFGGSTPILQKIAVRILGQTSSSSGCERNWSLFEQIHNKRRNRLEHQRLNDIVFVTYNLRLKTRLHQKKRSYDPIDYQSIDLVDFWVTEEVEEPELPTNIEELFNEDNSIPPICVDDGETNLVGMPCGSFDDEGEGHENEDFDQELQQINAYFDDSI